LPDAEEKADESQLREEVDESGEVGSPE
jgi:hypothetical protein